ncbi:hypothetical protein BaRGS_00016947 [Batillaria attramentaria]|uniref:Uncharacterized protein n=1 Tax=Batillaria attramentaria TaxID=370345 RepID=A0ABD0KXJ2_9CAEN
MFVPDAAIAERLPTPIKSRYPRCRHMVHEQLPTAIDEGPFRMITSIQLPPSLTDGRLITLQLHALTGEALCHRTICIQGRYFQPYRSFGRSCWNHLKQRYIQALKLSVYMQCQINNP